ncbi:hypothetical protein NM688_g3060 [Phlebia brevispora]|uniref:Uncharacterized protein n=1 Tax=Phlebia brevispora TaxID=194682 RepID=A0ACC1T6L6_9APHY|nr:hypothetical protein NM688_g3060 [Phlebia brevispora]
MIASARFLNVFALAAIALTAVLTVNAIPTQVMRRPDTYKDTPHAYQSGNPTPKVLHKRAGAKTNSAYFTNWGIYGANFQPTDINPDPLTLILYAFADVSPDTGNISLTDTYADEQVRIMLISDRLYLLKMANRNLKVSLSVGGWTYSQDGHFSFVTDATSRATFVSSAVQFISDYGLDGIDIDFEYPSSPEQAQGFADLLTALRSAFDELASSKGDATPYLLTAAVPAGESNYQYLVVPQMDQALNYWNLMAYDYAGSWLNYTDNQANLYGGARTGVSTDKAIKWYLGQGATPSKMVMGIPLYGRAFEDTAGLGDSYNGVGPGTLQAGIYSYNVLPLAGATVYENLTDVSSYSYDPVKMELVSYDDPHIASLKAQYVETNGLGGSMFWDLSTDKNGTESLVSTTASVYSTLDQTLNHLDYPTSKWDNIRNNMGTSGSGTSTSSSAASSPTGVSGSGQCAGVAAWSSSSIYTGGQTAVYNGDLWTAKWWTEGDTPGGSAGVWTDDGAC